MSGPVPIVGKLLPERPRTMNPRRKRVSDDLVSFPSGSEPEVANVVSDARRILGGPCGCELCRIGRSAEALGRAMFPGSKFRQAIAAKAAGNAAFILHCSTHCGRCGVARPFTVMTEEWFCEGCLVALMVGEADG